jgi:hypothetical protein
VRALKIRAEINTPVGSGIRSFQNGKREDEVAVVAQGEMRIADSKLHQPRLQ